MFQRQLSKEGLSNVVNQSGKSAASHMSTEDLADLFTPGVQQPVQHVRVAGDGQGEPRGRGNRRGLHCGGAIWARAPWPGALDGLLCAPIACM